MARRDDGLMHCDACDSTDGIGSYYGETIADVIGLWCEPCGTLRYASVSTDLDDIALRLAHGQMPDDSTVRTLIMQARAGVLEACLRDGRVYA